ncbi:Diaminopimelate epimerase-like protein [Lactarius psammicola]|nr:Diaminopimelate epimerase-like protein [Lactarius psammicola]
MTVDTRPQTLPFSIENAFTDRLEGGNPAAIVRVPSLTALPDATLQLIARNFNQPMTVFIAPRETNASDPSGTATFGIRWFTPEIEAPLCGHGTLVAAAGVFHSAEGARGPTTIRFEAPTGKFLIARRVEGGRVEIDLDAGRSEALVGAEDAQLREVLARALGKHVRVKYTGRGMAHLDKYALIEVDTHDLKGLKVDTDALRDSPFLVHVVVAPSSVSGVTFESRMFAPRAGIPEDPVCGTAHTLSTPYWMATKELSGVVSARQVSARGGDLKIQFDAAEQRIKLAGQVKTVSKGELFVE